MLTTRDAARALGAAAARPDDSSETVGRDRALQALAGRLGFGQALPLDRRERVRIGLGPDTSRASIAPGEGSLRALIVEWVDGPWLRERLTALARTLVRASPTQHWLVVARHTRSAEVAIAAPAPEGSGPLAVMLVDTRSILESDAETLASLAAVREHADLMVHLRWRELLGREALSRRFYRDLERVVDQLARTATGRADARDRRTVALLTTSRLLFLAFLEAKGWLDGDRAFLRRELERTAAIGGVQRALLEPLFFGTLNTPFPRRAKAALAFGRVPFLNGGLFSRSDVETRCRTLRLNDDAIGSVIGDLLGRYRLTARETSDTFSEAAVDPEMLGRAFESLMGDETRRARGAFYTPQPLIRSVTRQALDALDPAVGPARALRVLDPACGSGAFLVFALEELAARRAATGDRRPLSAIRRDILARSIFGVDVDPTAVWLCQLRLWLSVVVEDEREEPMRLPPLPNLDRNVREGDALAGFAFGDAVDTGGDRLESLRLRYARASGSRKRTLARLLDRAERSCAIGQADRRLAGLATVRRELLLTARSPDLFRTRRGVDAAMQHALDAQRSAMRALRAESRRLRDGGALPFSFGTHFPEIAADGGFDLVTGNPPWVRPHAVPAQDRVALRRRFESFRRAWWEAGATAAAAGRGFASQADLAALFTERALDLLRPGGVMALLLPSKLWSALAGGGIRDVLTTRATILALEDWPDSSAGFEAAVYPSALVARRAPARGADRLGVTVHSAHRVRVTVHGADGDRSWSVASDALPFDPSIGAPWLLLPPEVRSAFDVLGASGTPLCRTGLGRPVLGVKTGCNAAFVVERTHDPAPPAEVSVISGSSRGAVDADFLRPLVRGEGVRAWEVSNETESIVWTHDQRGVAVGRLPAATRRWLSQWRRELEQRSDARTALWWSLFRTEAARCDRARVVWGDIGLAPRAAVLARNDRSVPLNTCYVVFAPTDDDGHALAALLNSDVAAAWLRIVAEPARGGYRRFLGWTCALLPTPRDWARARALLAPLGRSAARGLPPDADSLRCAVLRAYDVTADQLAPLLEWSAR